MSTRQSNSFAFRNYLDIWRQRNPIKLITRVRTLLVKDSSVIIDSVRRTTGILLSLCAAYKMNRMHMHNAVWTDGGT